MLHTGSVIPSDWKCCIFWLLSPIGLNDFNSQRLNLSTKRFAITWLLCRKNTWRKNRTNFIGTYCIHLFTDSTRVFLHICILNYYCHIKVSIELASYTKFSINCRVAGSDQQLLIRFQACEYSPLLMRLKVGLTSSFKNTLLRQDSNHDPAVCKAAVPKCGF